MPAVPILPRRPARHDAPIAKSTSKPEHRADFPLKLLSTVASWPDLDGSLREHSLNVLACKGVTAWRREGGILTLAGLPGFSDWSRTAFDLPGKVGEAGGFRYTCEAMRRWCVRLIERKDGAWSAVAIGGECLSYLIGHGARAACALQLRRELTRRHLFKNSFGPEVDQFRCCIRSLVEQIRKFDGAPRLLPVLFSAVKSTANGELRISQQALGRAFFSPARAGWPFNWRLQVFDALMLLSKISVRALTVQTDTWAPNVFRKQGAASWPAWDRDNFRIRLTPEFIRFMEVCFREP